MAAFAATSNRPIDLRIMSETRQPHRMRIMHRDDEANDHADESFIAKSFSGARMIRDRDHDRSGAMRYDAMISDR
jgi:hypothetical protein